ncbi:hypothetical protein COW36_21930 [bacterium (Candidatus Blackallbacteria) CG17_big_fil_post_rev_8_21_14_2_50_48_46]|uniref:Uncharacterized protein n=1 Tax=bacterium (Candidatus Blackallbacteria) CG17_big_fil_post_rev_8_21_14_2_50_48_46 TaxID=2014261 RepID=A0A2M7FY70_9BACT|nr:MAG: hypothetical protein COW64_13360 [bacterium (Candidatus Blackallbacteria) CG18_big_fil_WC_8_21_14_2_50_49_26]PIW14278.1 MAG: hypothetical protein COW36_21930 [bacterium (Candidatus Blackallbacteria) CG17_big_fil_post_rev_8_21_14_2_50_48_46]PIW45547.1 MAG: hypothetical protein COW20_19535 [bacterium (Candidatus Blackallbacteria) CG13_big_fil_rev_8_21_14_2_50_49_14]
MGQIRITAQQPRMTLRIQEGESRVVSPQTDETKPSPRPAKAEVPELLNPNEAPPSPDPSHYLERLSPPTTRQTLGSDSLQLEVGYQSKGTELLTRAQDPGLVENLKALNGPNQGTGAEFLQDKTLMTGTVIRPDEAVSVRVGIASSVDTSQFQNDREHWLKQLPAAARAGVYAGVGVQTGPVASNIIVDTALGQPRIGAGMAVNIATGATVGVSYLNQPNPLSGQSENTLRLGAEVFSQQDTVIGANLTQPLQRDSADATQTAFGLYLNTRFH